MNPPRRLHAVVGVWGAPHVERWATHSLATQLSAGNLPALAARGIPVDYHVVTDAESVERVRERTAPLARYAHVHVHRFDEAVALGQPLSRYMQGSDEARMKRVADAGSAAWAIEHVLAVGGDPALAILSNDFVFSDGALAHAFGLLERGAGAVMVPVLRIAREATGWPAQGPALEPGGPGLAAHELGRMLLDSLHSLTRRLDAESDQFSDYPASVLWRVGDEGWLCRSFMPHPVMVIPVAGRWAPWSTADYTLGPALHSAEGACRLPQAAEPIVVLKHTSTATFDESGAPRARLSVERMARFLYFCTHRVHRSLAAQPVRLPAGPMTEAAWAEAEARSLAQVDDWYRHLDTLGPGLHLGDTPAAAAWRASHYGRIGEFLCPGRLNQRAAESAEFAEVWRLARLTLTSSDLRADLARSGFRAS